VVLFEVKISYRWLKKKKNENSIQLSEIVKASEKPKENVKQPILNDQEAIRHNGYESDHDFDPEPDTEMDMKQHITSPQTPLTHAGSEQMVEHMSELDLGGADRARTDGELELRKAIEAQPTVVIDSLPIVKSLHDYEPPTAITGNLLFARTIVEELTNVFEEIEKEQLEREHTIKIQAEKEYADMSKVATDKTTEPKE